MNEIRSARTNNGFDTEDLTLPLGEDGVSESLDAGNRFAVSSSPEISPTGLKAVAASALLGYVGPSSELGLDCNP